MTTAVVQESAAPALKLRDRIGLSAYYFATFAAVGFSTPFLPLYWRSLGFSYLQIGALVALASAAGAVALVPFGALSDRLRARHPFIVAGSLTIGACFLLYSRVHAFGLFAALQAIAGIGNTTSASVAAALGADLFQRSKEGRSFAGVRSRGTIGFIGTMAVVYFAPSLVNGPRFFAITASLYAVAAVSILFVRRASDGLTATRARMDFRGVRIILADRNTAAFVAAYFLGYMALMPGTANLSLYLKSFRPAIAPSIIPLAYAISATCELPFLMGMGWLSDRFGRTLPMRVCFAVLPIRLALYSVAPVPAMALALQATHGLTFSVLAVVPFAFLADSAPGEYRATGQAILNAAGAAAYAIGPLAAGQIADLLGIRDLYVFLGAVALVGSLILFAVVREPGRPAGRNRGWAREG